MSERLSELSASVSLELRTRLEDSRTKTQAAQKTVDGLRREAVTDVNGIRKVLDEIVAKLEEADDLHLAALKQVSESYGHPPNSDAPGVAHTESRE